jgi:hypothetical protein
VILLPMCSPATVPGGPHQRLSQQDHPFLAFLSSFFLVLGLELRVYILSHSTSPFLC